MKISATTLALSLGVLASVISVLAFVATVGVASSFQISSAPADWGLFGDYMGGVLGTVFSGLAFLVILWTLKLQQQQITQLREQDKFKELQNSMSTLANNLEVSLSREVAIKYHGHRSTESFLKLLIVLGGMAPCLPHTREDSELFEPVKHALGAEFPLFVRALDTYAAVIHLYQARGGDADIARVFLARFELIARLVRSSAPHMELGLSDDAYKVFDSIT